jgi:hypothetical protein
MPLKKMTPKVGRNITAIARMLLREETQNFTKLLTVQPNRSVLWALVYSLHRIELSVLVLSI